MTAKIRPGDIVPITFDDDRTFDVVVLGLLGQKKLMGVLDKLRSAASASERLDFVLEALRMFAATPITDEWLETINLELANEIIGKAVNAGQVSEEERKKSESPHL